jgi:hypothetical protein
MAIYTGSLANARPKLKPKPKSKPLRKNSSNVVTLRELKSQLREVHNKLVDNDHYLSNLKSYYPDDDVHAEQAELKRKYRTLETKIKRMEAQEKTSKDFSAGTSPLLALSTRRNNGALALHGVDHMHPLAHTVGNAVSHAAGLRHGDRVAVLVGGILEFQMMPAGAGIHARSNDDSISPESASKVRDAIHRLHALYEAAGRDSEISILDSVATSPLHTRQEAFDGFAILMKRASAPIRGSHNARLFEKSRLATQTVSNALLELSDHGEISPDTAMKLRSI